MKRKNESFIKKINNEIDDFKKKVIMPTCFKEDDESLTIIINLKEQEIFKPYSGESLLQDDIFEFIEEIFKFANAKSKIKYELIFPENMELETQQKIKDLIKIHYALKFKEYHRKNHNNSILSWSLLLFGSLIFIIYGILEWNHVNFLFQGIIEIFAWVFIWASCESFFFTKWENRHQMVKYLRLLTAEFIN